MRHDRSGRVVGTTDARGQSAAYDYDETSFVGESLVKGFVAWDEWAENPGKALGIALTNIGVNPRSMGGTDVDRLSDRSSGVGGRRLCCAAAVGSTPSRGTDDSSQDPSGSARVMRTVASPVATDR